MNVLLVIGLIMLLGTVGGRVFRRMNLPQVMGYMLIGLLLGESFHGFLSGPITDSFRPIISLALGFWYVIFGYETTKRRLAWVKPRPLIGTGILLAIFVGLAGVLFNGSFLSPVDFGAMLHLPLPAGFYLSTSFLFELAICLAVLGSASYMLDTLGHPGD